MLPDTRQQALCSAERYIRKREEKSRLTVGLTVRQQVLQRFNYVLPQGAHRSLGFFEKIAVGIAQSTALPVEIPVAGPRQARTVHPIQHHGLVNRLGRKAVAN